MMLFVVIQGAGVHGQIVSPYPFTCLLDASSYVFCVLEYFIITCQKRCHSVIHQVEVITARVWQTQDTRPRSCEHIVLTVVSGLNSDGLDMG